MEAYRYTPLEHQDSVRLLVLLPGSFDDPIECCLLETFVSPRHSYIALSYVWGDASDRISCTVWETARRPAFGQSLEDFCAAGSPRKLEITPNLCLALQHLRMEDRVKVIWADGICINQDNTAERSRQIQLMTDIYRTADVVCIWLGLRDQDSDVAFQWVYDCEAKLRADPEVSTQTTGADSRTEQAEPGIDSRRIAVNSSQLDAIDNTFSAKASRKWWERKWTIQEIVFAKKALLVCGDTAIWWDTLARIHDTLEKNTNAGIIEHDGRYSYEGLGIIVLDSFHKLEILRWKCASRFAEEIEAGKLLHYVLNFTQGTECSDPRDHVYGVLGLLGPKSALIAPDYAKTEREVFLDAALHIMSDATNLDFLCSWFPLEPSSGWHSIASWVPNIADPDRASNFRLYNAGDSLPSSSVGTTLDYRGVLNLRGISCGTIESFAASFELESQSNGDAVSERNLESLAPDLCPQDRDVSDDFVRALVSDLDIGGFMSHSRGQERLPSDRLGDYRQAYREYIRPGFPAERLGWEAARTGGPIISAAVCIQAALKVMCKERLRFCRTSSGYLGWAPKRTLIGDSVYVVFGSKIPFVLRSKAGGDDEIDQSLGAGKHFTMVGTAFFQGVMDGELLRDSGGNKVPGEAIYIH